MVAWLLIIIGSGNRSLHVTPLLSLIPPLISNHVIYKCGMKESFQFAKFNGATVEVWEWIDTFIPYFTGHVVTYPCRD